MYEILELNYKLLISSALKDDIDCKLNWSISWLYGYFLCTLN